MNAHSDGQEIVIISPEAVKIIAEIKKRQEERKEIEKILREQAEAVGFTIREIMNALETTFDAILAAFGVTFESLSDALRQIAEAMGEAAEIVDHNATAAKLKRWRADERRYSAVNAVKYRQFERERENRSAILRGNMKIGRNGRRTGPKKAKNHKIGERRWTGCRKKAKTQKK
jgi:hypothetical protein